MKNLLLLIVLYGNCVYSQNFSDRMIELNNVELTTEIKSYIDYTTRSIQKTEFEDFIIVVNCEKYFNNESFTLSAILQKEDVFDIKPDFFTQIDEKVVLFIVGFSQLNTSDTAFCHYIYNNYTLRLKDLSKYKSEAMKKMQREWSDQPDTIKFTKPNGEVLEIVKSKLKPVDINHNWSFEALNQLKWEVIFQNGILIQKRGIKDLGKSATIGKVW